MVDKETDVNTWRTTDDPNDPCSYCVQWRWRNPNGEVVYDHDIDDCPEPFSRAEPYMPDGTVPPRIYRDVHNECGMAVAEYSTTGD